MDLKQKLKELRPSLSASSITTYASILKNLHRKVFGDDKVIELPDFKRVKAILGELKDTTPNKRKTILSALVVLTDDKHYRDMMLSDIKDYKTEISKQEKSKTQEENWLEPQVLESKLQQLKRDADLLYKKKLLSPFDLQQIQNYIILLLFSGKYFPPRRSKDYTDFRINNIDKKKDNFYLTKMVLH